MCAAATAVSSYQKRAHHRDADAVFELENEWDDRQSSESENLHDALFGEDIPLLEQFSSKRSSSQTASSPEEESQAAKKSKSETEHSSSIFPMSPKKYSLLQSQDDSGSNASTAKLKDKLQKKITSKISGARFRWINEQLYTRKGDEALNMFEQDPTLFDVYHKGFSAQASKWPMNPLDKIIAYVQDLPSSAVVADFGCGEARLAQSVPNTVYSFDFVALNSHITPCDMANVPLSNSSVDVCVFCLSLMGTNISDFIKESRRVLRKNGSLKICEIASRFESEDEFARSVEMFGFQLVKSENFNKLFVEFEFKVTTRKKSSSSKVLPEIELKPCMYKRR